MKHTITSISLAVGILCLPVSAHADLRTYLDLAAAGEILVPDMRLQRDDEFSLAMTFPVGLTLVELPKDDANCRPCLRTSIWAEPQLEVRRGDLRGFGYLREQLGFTTYADVIFTAEGGYLVGEDGSGPGVGVGIGLGHFHAFGLHLVARRYFLGGKTDRYDLALDLEFTFSDGLF